jgi:hypothetical protein
MMYFFTFICFLPKNIGYFNNLILPKLYIYKKLDFSASFGFYCAFVARGGDYRFINSDHIDETNAFSLCNYRNASSTPPPARLIQHISKN